MSVPYANRDSQRRTGRGDDRPARRKTAPDGGQTPSRLPADDVRTDEQLLAAYRQNDKRAFAELVERYERELFHFLVRFLGDRAAAEDVFQEAFLQVHQSADQFDPSRRFRPWLFTIAANKARDLMRSQARRPTNPLQASISPGDEESGQYIDLMESSAVLPGAPLEKEELQQQVHKTVMNMPEHLREILLLSYFHQFPYKQISDILAIPLGTVKSRLHAAVAHFADRWRNVNQGESLS
jgi:RNA polymerase sigma-70 factor, ECF subfamily